MKSRIAGIVLPDVIDENGNYFRDPETPFAKAWRDVFGDIESKKGGEGSGYFGHAGRPGKVGGSSPKNGVSFGIKGDRLGGGTTRTRLSAALNYFTHMRSGSVYGVNPYLHLFSVNFPDITDPLNEIPTEIYDTDKVFSEMITKGEDRRFPIYRRKNGEIDYQGSNYDNKLTDSELSFIVERLGVLRSMRYKAMCERLGIDPDNPTAVVDALGANYEKETRGEYISEYGRLYHEIIRSVGEIVTREAVLSGVTDSDIKYLDSLVGNEVWEKSKSGSQFDKNRASFVSSYFNELWNQHQFVVRNLVCLGKIDPENPEHDKKWGGSMRFLGGEKWSELPDTLYHVTTNVGAVQASRLKSRRELEMDQSVGLSGGDDTTISFTTDLETARGIERAMYEANAVAKGRITMHQMLTDAQRGRGGVGKDWSSYLVRGGKDGESYDLTGKDLHLMEGYVRNALEYEKNDGLDWRGKPIPREKYLDDLWSFWHIYYTSAREHAGGYLDPVFFGASHTAIAKIDPRNIGTLKLKPVNKKAKGYKLGSLNEIRVFGGDTVKLEEVIRYYDAGDLESVLKEN